jgi:hypothetical protein
MVEFSQAYRRLTPEIIQGPVADPVMEIMLPKELLARIKYRKLDMLIQQLEMEKEILVMQRDMLAKEYNIG